MATFRNGFLLYYQHTFYLSSLILLPYLFNYGFLNCRSILLFFFFQNRPYTIFDLNFSFIHHQYHQQNSYYKATRNHLVTTKLFLHPSLPSRPLSQILTTPYNTELLRIKFLVLL